jgi:hypothetical protein
VGLRLNNQIKPKKCKCGDIFTPVRRGLKVSKTCGNAGCELDLAERSGNKKPKPKAKKQRKISVLKKELWDWFSLHQKLVYSEDGEWCNCYTCDNPIKIGSTNCQGGHCLSKAANGGLYFDERAVRPQCYYCNINLGGDHYHFNERLKQEIGLQAWQDMYDNRKAVQKRTREWYEEKIHYYKAQCAEIKLAKSSY